MKKEKQINPECWKYERLYKNHQSPGCEKWCEKYGHTNHGKKWIRRLIEDGTCSVLDIGCGYNEFIKELIIGQSELNFGIEIQQAIKKRKMNFIGIDFACPGADLILDVLSGLPFANKEFEYVTAFDMLEHLRKEQIPIVLKEMKRVSGKFIFTISYVASLNKADGETLHPTVKPKEWWLDMIGVFGRLWVYGDGSIYGEWNK